jgi:HTH-type transcriptional regulator / antitoxin HigA
MQTMVIVIDSDAELARAGALVDHLMNWDKPEDLARLTAQARLIAAYEEEKWPPRAPNAAEVVRYLTDQHGLTQADLAPLLGGADRAGDILRGRRYLTLAMVQRLRARFQMPTDLLLSPAATRPTSRSASCGSATAPKPASLKTSCRLPLGRAAPADPREPETPLRASPSLTGCTSTNSRLYDLTLSMTLSARLQSLPCFSTTPERPR